MKNSIRKRDEPRDYVVVPNQLMSDVPNLNGDWLNFYLLILLYIIQGFPVGLSGAFPIILQSKKLVTYEEQALFSITLWPHSLKLFWAPVVDSLHVQWIGRRKSWLLPLQLIMGLLLLCMANNIDTWLPNTGQPNLKMLIIVVFIINFLSATQDIVVDGWALTMLKKKNVRYASTCNAVGVPIGMFIGSVCFTLLMSEQFWNTHLRTVPSAEGLVTMKTFLTFAGIVTLSVTTMFAVFKKEKDNMVEDGYVKISVLRSYKLLWEILKMPRIRILAAILLSARFGFASVESVSNLKLIDVGLSKDDIMLITVVSYVIKIILPIFISKYTTSSKPMSYYLKLTPIRLLWAIAYVLLIHYTPSLIYKNGVKDVTLYYYVFLGSICLINEMMSFFMLLALFAFFCQLSDPKYGGTYMTLFNTFFYLGFLASHSIVLKLVDILTFSHCSTDVHNSCSTVDSLNLCKSKGGQCEIDVDGYYIAIGICMVTGFAWYGIFKNIIKEYQSLSISHWMVNFNDLNTNDSKEPNNIMLS